MNKKNHLKKGFISRDNGFLVQVLYVLFYWAEKISVFYWLRILGEKLNKDKNKKPFVKTYIFPEIWAMGNVFFAGFVSFQILKIVKTKWVAWVLLIYAIERTFEMLVYQVNVLFFHRLNSEFRYTENVEKPKAKTDEYKIKSATRTVILLIFNMVEYIFQFAVMFAALGVIADDPSMNIGMVRSFELFMSSSDIENYSHKIYIIPVYFESLIGVFMNIVCLARFVGMLPEVKTIDK